MNLSITIKLKLNKKENKVKWINVGVGTFTYAQNVRLAVRLVFDIYF